METIYKINKNKISNFHREPQGPCLSTSLNSTFFLNPFLLHCENIRGTSIPNFKSVCWVVFEIQRWVSQWYLDLILYYIDCVDSNVIYMLFH